MNTHRWPLSICLALLLAGPVSAQNKDSASTPASTPATATPDAAPAPAAGDSVKIALRDSRKLMPNDILAIRVLGENDLTVERRVSNDGSITYPFLDLIKVAGKTPAEVEVTIRDGLAKDYLVNPQVLVDVKDYVKQFFVVRGQVNRPGQIEYPVDRKVDVLDAIGMAGDFARLATSKRRVEILRGAEKFEFTEKQLKDQIDPEKKFYVQPNDQINVAERVF